MTERRAHYLARTAARKDKNHDSIVRGLRQCGYYVWNTHKVGMGFPDVLALSHSHIPVLLEIKSPGGTLTDDEQKFHTNYRGPIRVVYTFEEALAIMEYYDDMRMEVAHTAPAER